AGAREDVKYPESKERDPALSELQYDILEALRHLKGIDSEKRKTAAKIASSVGGDATGNSCKVPLATLKSLGLVQSKEGRGGGSWLTARGQELIDRVRPKKL